MWLQCAGGSVGGSVGWAALWRLLAVSVAAARVLCWCQQSAAGGLYCTSPLVCRQAQRASAGTLCAKPCTPPHLPPTAHSSQCAKPHTLDRFAEGRRSCRESLLRHNRRRKPLGALAGGLGHCDGVGLGAVVAAGCVACGAGSHTVGLGRAGWAARESFFSQAAALLRHLLACRSADSNSSGFPCTSAPQRTVLARQSGAPRPLSTMRAPTAAAAPTAPPCGRRGPSQPALLPAACLG